MTLRKGKTKTILMNSIDCALLAVEIFNKPKAPFKVQHYITHMIIAWTKLFHAYFHYTKGEKYFYKEKNNRTYQRIKGEKKAWDLNKCIKEYGKLPEAERANLIFFIELRNKIEHRYIDRDEIGINIFGECQSLLYNYENLLINFFGLENALYESLVFSLQFSRMRTKGQFQSTKKLMTKEVEDVKNFITEYRNSLSDDILKSQNYNIKLIQVANVTNTRNNDLAVEFVKLDENSTELEEFNKIVSITKNKIVKQEIVNLDKQLPSIVINEVNKKLPTNCYINQYDHTCLYTIFLVKKKISSSTEKTIRTNNKYCLYDEPHKDYLYTQAWIDFLIHNILSGRLKKEKWRELFKKNKTLDIKSYELKL